MAKANPSLDSSAGESKSVLKEGSSLADTNADTNNGGSNNGESNSRSGATA